MKEERVHKLLLKIAIITFGIGVVISVIVTSIVFTTIHRGEIRELETQFQLASPQIPSDVETPQVEEIEEATLEDEDEDEDGNGTAQVGRRMSVEIVPEILAGGIVTQLLASDDEHWYLKLVNQEHFMDEGFEPVLEELIPGHFLDYRVVPYALEMLESASDAGMDLIIVSSFRSYADQIALFNAEMNRWAANGYGPYRAFMGTRTRVAFPGQSEHALGLALDIVSADNHNLDDSQSLTPENQWLRENSWRYGFVQRYLEDKIHVTGIIYEPWHFRFVGQEAARRMWEEGLVLEEYLLERHLIVQ